MKIIGYAGTGHYLVQASENELAQALGFSWASDAAWVTLTRPSHYASHGAPKPLAIGVVLEVTALQAHMRKALSSEEACRVSAKALRAMAELIEGGLPTAIIPPPAPAPETEGA